MDPILQWGLDVIIAVQQISGPAMDAIFKAISFMGEQEFYLLIFPFIFWSLDASVGARLAILFLVSGYINTDIKDIIDQPRPYHLDPSVGISEAEGFGMPSGHSQSAVVVWGTIGNWVRKRWVWGVAILLMILIGFSRVYLGVHFPTQVLAGWSIGAVLLGLYVALHLGIQERLAALSLGQQLLLAIILPVILILVHPVDDTTATMAVLSGLGIGLALAHRYVHFTPGGAWWQRVVRFLIGVTVIFAIFIGLRLVFPEEGEPLYLVFRFVRYGLIGLWVSLGGPWLFAKLRLAPATAVEPAS